MTGRRPDVTRVYSFADHFREKGVGDNWESLPQIFKENGHLAFGVGKLYHPMLPPNYDGVNSWSPEVLAFDTVCLGYNGRPNKRGMMCPKDCPTCLGPIFNPMELNACPGNQNPACKQNKSKHNPACAPTDPVDPKQYSPDEVGGVQRQAYVEASGGFGGGLMWCPKVPYQDLNITARAEEYIQIAAKSEKQFFLGVGLHKPHLPFQAPQEWFDKYPLEEVPLPLHKTLGKGTPSIAWHETMDSPSPWIPLPDWKLRETRRAYKAAISFMDHHIGTLRQSLANAGHAEDTAILYHADHGCAWPQAANGSSMLRALATLISR